MHVCEEARLNYKPGAQPGFRAPGALVLMDTVTVLRCDDSAGFGRLHKLVCLGFWAPPCRTGSYSATKQWGG